MCLLLLSIDLCGNIVLLPPNIYFFQSPTTTTKLTITVRLSLQLFLEPAVVEYHYRFGALTDSDRTTGSDRWTIITSSWLEPAVINMVL